MALVAHTPEEYAHASGYPPNLGLCRYAVPYKTMPLIVTTPTEDGYIMHAPGLLPEEYVPRRMFVHAFPAFCMRAIGEPRFLVRTESYLAFDSDVFRALPLQSIDMPQLRLPGTKLWYDQHVVTQPLPETPRHDWPAHFQAHAQFLVRERVGAVKRQRGRRRKRWTKVHEGAGSSARDDCHSANTL